MSRILKASTLGALLSAALLAAGNAQAAAPSVFLRVEGASATLLAQTPVQTSAQTKVRGDLCPGTSAAGALDVGTAGNWQGSYDPKFKDFLVSSILGETPSANNFWTLWINGRSSSTGACSTRLHPGDHELWFDCIADANFNCTNNPLALRLPAEVQVGHAVSGTVVQLDGAGHSAPVSGAALTGSGLSTVSGAGGSVKLTPRRTGLIELAARKSGATPSDPVTLCVYRRSRSECAAAGPVVHIAGISEHQVFKLGPRRLHGTVQSDPAGITDVSFSLARRSSSRQCSYFNAARGSWQPTGCSAKVPAFSIGAATSWSYLLPARLPAGSYRLAVSATDGNERRGTSAVDFRVIR